MTTYPRISKEGAMLALRAVCKTPFCDLAVRKNDAWNSERIAHEFSELVRMARSHTSIQVARCNRELTQRDETRERNLEKRIRAKVKELFALLPYVEFGGDPRGCTVTLRWGAPDSGSEWGIG